MPNNEKTEAKPESQRQGLAERVGERLSESKAFDDHHIELRVTDGEVVLTADR